jgi:polysaccharide biosynthesis protein PslF
MAASKHPTPITPYTGTPAPDQRLSSSFARRPRNTGAHNLNIAIVGAYAPATTLSVRHTRLLFEGLTAPDLSVRIVRAGRPAGTAAAPEVVHDLPVDADAGGEQAAAKALNRFDLVLIEHDFGVYGGPDGDQVLRLLSLLCVPVVVVAHTVPIAPSIRQNAILTDLARSADAVVTLSEDDRQQLHQAYGASLRKVLVIDEDGTAGRFRALIDALLRRPPA